MSITSDIGGGNSLCFLEGILKDKHGMASNQYPFPRICRWNPLFYLSWSSICTSAGKLDKNMSLMLRYIESFNVKRFHCTSVIS